MLRVFNNHRQPLTLEGGVILAAAGTPGSVRELETISEKDRRRHAGRIAVVEIEAPAAPAPEAPIPAPASSEDVTATKPLDPPGVEKTAEAEKKDQRQQRRAN
jgi:hypothetical protein